MDNNTLQKDILLKDYEMKVNYIEEHLSRMWIRLNIMMGIQTAKVVVKYII